MRPCSAREFVETNGRRGSSEQFAIVLKAQEYAWKTDAWMSIVPDSVVPAELARVSATFAFIAFPELRRVA